jgi:phage terminase large subunit-like protein
LSATTDLTSFALCFPREDGFDLLVKTWIPAERVGKKEKDDRVPYSMWVRDGSLLTTPGNVVDYDSIHAAVIEAAEQYNLHGVAYDPWNATQAAVKLEAEGVEMLEFRQGYRTMSGPAKAFEAAVLDHKARHNDNPVLNWMVGNTMVEMDPAENIKPSKKKSTQRIDGVVASVMAYGLALAANDDDDTSVYEDRGLLTL